MRGGARHFTFSKVMAWVAMDRAIRGAEEFNLPAPLDQWRALRQRDPRLGLPRGVQRRRRTASCSTIGGDALDASLLLLPLVGFLPAGRSAHQGHGGGDPAELTIDGLVLRYRTHEGVDGLPPGEGVFLACSFWLADNLVLQGRQRGGARAVRAPAGSGNDVGLLAEEYDPRARRQLGNFPQAFSHLALINTALNLENHGPAYKRGGR